MSIVSVNVSDLPIVAALFGQSLDPDRPGVRGVIAPLELVPEYVKSLGKFPCRFVLQGYEEHVMIVNGRPHDLLLLPESHIVWVMGKFLHTDHPPGHEMWSYGIHKPRIVAVRDVMDGVMWESPREQAWVEFREDEKIVRRRAIIEKQRIEKPARAAPAPRQAPSGGGGSVGTAVTKMTPEERAEYKARLLAKAVLTPRDQRHLARIERLEG